MMNSANRIASMAAAATLVLSLSPVSATAAAACASRSEVRSDIADLVASVHDDVKSAEVRSNLGHALVEALRAFRGVDADTAAERDVLGQKVRAAIQEMRDAKGKVDAAALVALIKSLREQREANAFTAHERRQLGTALEALRQAVLDRTQPGAERREVGGAIRAIQTRMAC